MSSGSSAWEGQLTSLVLSEYASTEMSIHALYMHEVIVCERVWAESRGHYSEHLADGHPSFLLSIFFPCSYTSSSPMASYPDTHGTGRRVTKAVTASPMKWGANPTRTPEISPVHTLSPPQFPAPVPFPLQPQPPAVPAWARGGLHHRAAPIGAIVGWPQVPFLCDLATPHAF